MRLGVILLNFGEPEHATLAEVVPFLERIFTTNASLEGNPTPEQVRARSRELAERRAPRYHRASAQASPPREADRRRFGAAGARVGTHLLRRPPREVEVE